jgi:hypothetical protein
MPLVPVQGGIYHDPEHCILAFQARQAYHRVTDP